MSGVSDGQVANESTFDSAYMFANGDTGTIGKVNLNNTSDVNSGVQIINAQRKINEIADSDGTNGEGDPNRKVYSSTNYISDGDNRKVAIGKLDTQLKSTQDDLDAAELDIADHESRITTIESSNSTFGGDKIFSGNVVIQQGLQVNGTTTFVNTTDMEVTDKNIVVNKGGNDASADGGGITVERTTVNGSLVYDQASPSKWKAGNEGTEDNLVTEDATQILTNKSIDGSQNTLTNIPFSSVTGTVPISNGGTGQTTQAAAFDALAPTTTKGDLIAHDGTDNIRLPVGTNGQVLSANSATPSGVEWTTISTASSGPQSTLIENLGISTSVASNALTINITQKDGSVPSSGSGAVRVAMRNSALTNGTFDIRSLTSALSLTISSGSTLGHLSGREHGIYVYLIDNAGTLELAVSHVLFTEGRLVSTVAEGGAGAADSNAIMYSQTARANVPFRVVGKLMSTQTVAGIWASNMSRIILGDYGSLAPTDVVFASYRNNSGQNIPNNTATNLTNWTINEDSHNIVNSITGIVTIPIDGEYEFSGSSTITDGIPTGNRIFRLEDVVGGSIIDGISSYENRSSGLNTLHIVPFTINATAGQQLVFRYFQDSGTNLAMTANLLRNYISIRKVGSNV